MPIPRLGEVYLQNNWSVSISVAQNWIRINYIVLQLIFVVLLFVSCSVGTLIETRHFGNGEQCNKRDCWDIPDFQPQTVTQSGRRDICTV